MIDVERSTLGSVYGPTSISAPSSLTQSTVHDQILDFLQLTPYEEAVCLCLNRALAPLSPCLLLKITQNNQRSLRERIKTSVLIISDHRAYFAN